jgi:tetratricopeptide (TPR) repeat protein
MLETIREFALERFAELPARDELRARHAAYYRALALTAGLDTDVPGEQHPEIVIPHAPNLRAALEWALEEGEIEFGLELLVALEQFWVLGYTDEGMRWFSAFLERADDAPQLLRARALRSFGSSAHFAGEFDLAERLWEESLAIYEALGDEHGIAVLLHRLSIPELVLRGDVERARELAERSLELHRKLANDKGAVQPMTLLGALALQAGDRDGGVALLEESAELAGRVPWRWWRAGTLSALADVALAEGREADARPLLREALELALALGDRVGLSWYLSQLALALARDGRGEQAGRIWGAVEAAAAFIPGGPWHRDAAALERDVLALADGEFERGREAGRSLALEEVAASVGDLD